MILDTLKNAERYEPLHKSFSKAFQFLQRPDIDRLEVGKYEIEGDAVFAIVAKDQGRAKNEAQLEIHNKYIDIQLVLAGVDEMGWKARSGCTEIVDAYDPESDIQFFTDIPTAWFITTPLHFAIFFPEDAHLPLISTGIVHKIIVKIAV
ncbi:MAG: biofilm protein TabA [Desulforhopalus sp.]|jgi:biofilm protein TabA